MRKVMLIFGLMCLVVGCGSSGATPSTTSTSTQTPRPKVTFTPLTLMPPTCTCTVTDMPSPVPTVTLTETPLPPTLTPTHTPIPPTPTPEPLRVWIAPAVPARVRELVTTTLPMLDAIAVASEEEAELSIAPNRETLLAQWIYALVVPFPTIVDDVPWSEVLRFWAGEGALTAISEDQQPPTLFVTEGMLATLEAVLGKPSEKAPIQVIDEGSLIDAAWNARPHAWAIVPFDELEPRWKVLRIDGANVLDREMRVYPLAMVFGAEGQGARELINAIVPEGRLLTNRETDKMTSLVMTGVTALVRAIATTMEEKGILYPAEHIGPLLKSADITHISNEIPFAQDCPPPVRNTDSLVFCSDPKYIELLRAVGTDIVELTGNHFQDYGSEATLMTIQMYDNEGWLHFGGGIDLAEAHRPVTMTHNDNALSFMGCNPVGPDFAWATEDQPGAAPCDFEYMHAELGRLREQVDVPIVTWQYWEHYIYPATVDQQADFRGMIEAGARIVSGSQAHHPQAIEFYKDGFIHYGLGNLFFDQMWSLGTRQEMIDRHIIYDGRHISTELFTYMLEDFSQPRPMTDDERRELLTAVFEASGW